jgi:citrate synthase
MTFPYLAGSGGGANEDVLNMLDEIGEVKNVRAYIENRLKNKAVIWGLGHREYSVKDPRAKIAVTMAEKVLALIVCSACKIKQASNNLTISSSGSSPNDMVKKFLAYDISLLGEQQLHRWRLFILMRVPKIQIQLIHRVH